MSKAEGKKIAIKFNGDLTNDFEEYDNSSAFTIRGGVPKYIEYPSEVLGMIEEKTFEVESVQRYPIEKLWELESPLELNSSLTEGGSEDVSGLGTPIFHSEFSPSYRADLAFNGSLIDGWYATGAVGRWIGLDFGSNPKKISFFRIYVGDGRFKGFVFEASNNNSSWTTLLTGEFANAIEWEEHSVANDIEYRYYRLRCTSVYTGSNVGIKELELHSAGTALAYDSETIYQFANLGLVGDYRLRYSGTTPNDTSLTVECKLSDEWEIINNFDVVALDALAELRVTLSTIDMSITPTMEDLWFEEPSAPQDLILLTMANMSEFKNIEGDLTVSYNASLGNLVGPGGAVQSFTEVFTPTDLVRVPNPLLAEKINAGITNLSADLIRIYYKDGYDSEIISASITDLSVNLIHVDNLNP